MKIAIVGPGIMPIPPTGWGAVEILIWDQKLALEELGHEVRIVNTASPIDILKEINHIVILGGLVGDFITNKYLKLSQDINEKGLINFIDNLDNYTNIEKVIFVSTC